MNPDGDMDIGLGLTDEQVAAHAATPARKGGQSMGRVIFTIEADPNVPSDMARLRRAERADAMAYVLRELCESPDVSDDLRTIAREYCHDCNIAFEEIWA